MAKREPIRLSSVLLFEKNLLDPTVLISTSSIYLLCCITLSSDCLSVKFLVIFSVLCAIFNYHLESYRSFDRVRKCIQALESDEKLALKQFLSNHLRYLKPSYVFQHPIDKVDAVCASHKAQISEDQRAHAKEDTYRWVNKIISFFWPYLSHVVHHELNEFLVNSRRLSRNDGGLKRLLYAFIKQIDANILAIERCELGSNAPHIKSIHVANESKDASRVSLVYDLDLAYEGNMNISLICSYFCCCSSRLGLKDVFVNLNSRFVVGPIDGKVPSIERFSFSLLKLPKFGYKGIALVELAELRLARRSLNQLVKEHLLYPKSVSVTFNDLMATIKKKQQETAMKGAKQVGNQPGRVGCSSQDNDIPPERLPWTTRLAARLMFCVCMCSNTCLRFCEKEKLNRDSLRLQGMDQSV